MVADDLNLSLRPATADDLPFAWRLYEQAMKPLTEALLEWHEARQRQTIARDMASGDTTIIVHDGQDVGWLCVQEDSQTIELCQLYVAPEMQNRGIGTCILRQLINDARHNDKALTLSVMKNNRARELYARLGFVQSGESTIKRHMIWGNGRV